MSRSASEACVSGAMAVAPASAMAAVFGIVRMTRASAGSRASIDSMGTPAAMEMTSALGLNARPMGRRTLSMTCGLTASTMTSAHAASFALSRVVVMPCSAASSDSRSSRTSLAWICAAVTVPEWSSPLMSAPAMFPAPMKPIFLSSIVTILRRSPRLEGDSPRCDRASRARMRPCPPL